MTGTLTYRAVTEHITDLRAAADRARGTQARSDREEARRRARRGWLQPLSVATGHGRAG
jgi:hypothetical protein